MKETILIIDDERTIADTVVYALTREGFEAHWCSTAKDGLAWLQGRHADLLVLDVGLPDKNGLDLCREIRQTSSLPIIFLTARNDELDRILGLEIGGDDYITKPFSPRELVARVRTILRRLQGPRTPRPDDPSLPPSIPSHRVGPFEDDKEQMRIRFQGIDLELSRYEYRLLALLLGRPSKVFSREEILNRAWEEPEMTTDRTVDAHIKSIRRKIKTIREDADPIRTVRGVGYSFELDTD